MQDLDIFLTLLYVMISILVIHTNKRDAFYNISIFMIHLTDEKTTGNSLCSDASFFVG